MLLPDPQLQPCPPPVHTVLNPALYTVFDCQRRSRFLRVTLVDFWGNSAGLKTVLVEGTR